MPNHREGYRSHLLDTDGQVRAAHPLPSLPPTPSPIKGRAGGWPATSEFGSLVPEVSAVSHHGCLILQGGKPFRDCCCSFMADVAIRRIGPLQGLIQRCAASAVSAGTMLNAILVPGASM